MHLHTCQVLLFFFFYYSFHKLLFSFLEVDTYVSPFENHSIHEGYYTCLPYTHAKKYKSCPTMAISYGNAIMISQRDHCCCYVQKLWVLYEYGTWDNMGGSSDVINVVAFM